MGRTKKNSSGFTLITTLMLLFILSGVAIGMLMMVNTEVKVGTQDVQNNVTFHAAEGGIEKMTADLANLFVTTLSPNPGDITALALNPGPPAVPGITFPNPGAAYPNGGYTYSPVVCTGANTPAPNCTAANVGVMAETPGTVSSGPYAGLNAELLQVNLQVTAQGVLGDEVQMSRTVEVALIPVFQFGAFADGDIAFFTNPTLTFNGRIHTNGDLYLGCAGGNTCTFTNKLTAYGNVIRAVIPNGLGAAAANDQGNVQIPGESGGCSGAKPECTTLPVSGDLWGSVTGAGGNPPASAYNSGPPAWVTLSESAWTTANKYLGGMMINGNYGNTPNTGATNLALPFVSGATAGTTPGLGNPPGPQNYEIVRRPPAGESTTSPLGASRLYNEAAIRVLLSDRPDELPGGGGDPDNVRLANLASSAGWGNGNDYSRGVPVLLPAAFGLPALGAGQVYTTYFAMASTAIPNPTQSTTSAATCTGGVGLCYYADWLFAPGASPVATEFANDGQVPMVQNANNYAATKAPPTISVQQAYPYYAVPTPNSGGADTQWNLIDGYLRVEFLPQNGACPGPGAQVNGYCAITREWLQLGFARDLAPPTSPGVPYVAGSNDVNPYAILIFQEPAKRNVTGWPNPPAVNTLGTAPTAGTCPGAGNTNCTTGTPPEIPYDLVLNGQNAAWQQKYLSDCTGTGAIGAYCTAGAKSNTAFNFYPINFYDAREGEPSDVVQTGGNANSCTPQGVMNAVELDVGNLNQWLQGNIPGSGTLVNNTNQNGYVLYFSDRRGMLPNPNGTQTIAAGNISGDAGFEDVVNSAAANRVPDGALEPIPAGKTISPEDNNLNGKLDNFGAQNLGLGLGYVPIPSNAPLTAYTAANSVNAKVNSNPPNNYLAGGTRMTCAVAGNISTSVPQKTWIGGARHVLKLVDASLGHVPTIPGGVFPTSSGGFTVGSENPVYVFGNYNTNCAAAGGQGCTPGNANYDPNWPTPPAAADPAHAAAGIVADAVTLLSNSWLDWNSILLSPTQPTGNRNASTSYYRMGIATGDVQPFPQPAWATGNQLFIGTDGGMGNFLRMLEDWNATGPTLNYNGSMVNLFFATYNTGLFKCCNYAVYLPPTRNYNFDTDFNTFQELPPGTPMFRDIDNLSYRQAFTPCTVGANNFCSN